MSFSRRRSRNSAICKIELFKITVNDFRLNYSVDLSLSVSSHVSQTDLGKKYHLYTIYKGVSTAAHVDQSLLDTS